LNQVEICISKLLDQVFSWCKARFWTTWHWPHVCCIFAYVILYVIPCFSVRWYAPDMPLHALFSFFFVNPESILCCTSQKAGGQHPSAPGVSLQEAAAVTLVFEGNRAEVNLQKKDCLRHLSIRRLCWECHPST
jgi:hypothetical protein